jgi:hypothetical protein
VEVRVLSTAPAFAAERREGCRAEVPKDEGGRDPRSYGLAKPASA